jgi:hypothetical protein
MTVNRKPRSVSPIFFIRTTFAAVILALPMLAAQSNSKIDPHTIPVIDGSIGPCSSDFTVTDAGGVPVYDAKIRVHIAYGFMNTHKLDLEVGTNIDGKATVTGLPDRIKHGLYFHASQADRTGEAFDDPANTCKAKFSIVLQKKTE